MEHVFSVHYSFKNGHIVKEHICLMTNSPKILEIAVWQRALEEASNKAKELNANILQIRKLL